MYEYHHRILQPNRSSENGQTHNADFRKSNKPLLEKKRRARINRSLEQLKTLLIDAIKNDHATGYSKLEKADILELAVKYLRNVRGQEIVAAGGAGAGPAVTARYRDGFSECAHEVDRFLSSVSGLSPDTRYRLMNHLAGCIKRPSAGSHLPPGAAGPFPPTPSVAPVLLPRPQQPPNVFASGPRRSSCDVTTPSSFELRHHFPSILQQQQQQQMYQSLSPAVTSPYNDVTASNLDATGRLSTGSASQFSNCTGSDYIRSGVTFRPIHQSSPDDGTSGLPSTNAQRSFVNSTGGEMTSQIDADEFDVTESKFNNVDGVNDVSDADDCEADWKREPTPIVVRPLAEKNNNADNIARGAYDVKQFGVESSPYCHVESAVISSAVVEMDDEGQLIIDELKDEPVWRPW